MKRRNLRQTTVGQQRRQERGLHCIAVHDPAPSETTPTTLNKRARLELGDELADRAASAALEMAPRAVADLAELDALTAAPLLAELAELRAENARLRGDDGPPASKAQVSYLTRLINRLSRRDAAAVIAYLAGWQGWSKRQQSAALLRLQALTGREALYLLPDPRKAEGGAR